MSNETQQLTRASEYRIKHIIGTSLVSIGGGIVVGLQIWAFLVAQFAPRSLTEAQLQYIVRDHEELKEKHEQLRKEHNELRIWHEQLKGK